MRNALECHIRWFINQAGIHPFDTVLTQKGEVQSNVNKESRKVKEIESGRSFIPTRVFRTFCCEKKFSQSTGEVSEPSNADAVFSDDRCLEAYNAMHQISQENIDAITTQLGGIDTFSGIEKKIFDNIMALPRAKFQHQSSYSSKGGSLHLLSIKNMEQLDITPNGTCTTDRDKEHIGNTDYVFFSVDFSGTPLDSPPIDNLQGDKYYGGYAYMINEEYGKYGYVTLKDQAHTSINYRKMRLPATEKILDKYRITSAFLMHTIQYINELETSRQNPIFTLDHMRLATALHTIENLRDIEKSKRDPEEVNRFKLFFADANPVTELPYMIKLVFNLEYHIPHRVDVPSDQYSKFLMSKYENYQKTIKLIHEPKNKGFLYKYSKISELILL